MNCKKLITRSLILFLTTFILSCSDDDNGPAVNKRNVRFEVSGNFSGVMDATYITESGGGTNETIPSLTWTKEINYAASVPSITILVGGYDGVAGQTITLKVFSGGKLISSTPGTANSNGVVAITAPPYVF